MDPEEKIDLENYTRLFSFDGSIPYLFSHQFVEAAGDLNYLAFGDESFWISYIHNKALEFAGEAGLVLYGSRKEYEGFTQGLYDTFNALQSETNELLTAPVVTREQMNRFIELLQKYRTYYTRTEFFYTDRAFEKQHEYPDIQENFKGFDRVKLDGRRYLNEAVLYPDSFLNKVLSKLAEQFGIPFEALQAYSTLELLELFEGKKLPSEEVAARTHYLTYIDDGEHVVVVGEPAKQKIARLKVKRTEEVITGKTASKGRVTAKARVIRIDAKEYEKTKQFVEEMQDGEVLVAETTEPSIILACNKASAIVTNQGGMMSHAAIVARELGIPCVVGTGDATARINTGDLIEVDADEGVVKVLERK